MFSVSMFPIGTGCSLRKPVAAVIDEIDRAGLRYQVTGMDTVIEGDWNDVIPVLRRAEERLRKDHDRVFMQLTMDDHAAVQDRLTGAVADVERELGRHVEHR